MIRMFPLLYEIGRNYYLENGFREKSKYDTNYGESDDWKKLSILNCLASIVCMDAHDGYISPCFKDLQDIIHN